MEIVTKIVDGQFEIMVKAKGEEWNNAKKIGDSAMFIINPFGEPREAED